MSQAITFRRNDRNDQSAGMGSIGNGSFKAADLATSPRWRSSPMSFKMGSFVGSLGSRMYPAPGCSPVPALDLQDFKMGSVSSSFDHSRFLQALSTSHTNDEGTSNYTCCGLPLNDLHALLDHFEESHVYVLDHHQQQQQQQQSIVPAPASATAPAATSSTSASNPNAPSAPVVPAAVPDHFDAMTLGGMDMDPNHAHDIDVDSTDSPLGSGSSSASSQNSSPTMGSQAALSAANGVMYPYYADLRNIMGASTPGGINPAESTITSNLSAQLQQQQAAQCIPPSLLFSPNGTPGASPPIAAAAPASTITTTSTTKSSPATAPATPAEQEDMDAGAASIKGSPSSSTKPQPAKIKTSPEALATAIDETLVVSGPDIIHPGPPPPTQAPTSLAKPFKCPTPHCNKAYKQANGLKYHMTHGQCCFLPKDPALEGLDEIEKDKVERPFGCGVGGCERRYKNMNGLRYHYQHSGAHGAVGLALLAAGTHSVQIAAHNAAVGRNSAKAAARAAAAAASSSSPTSPRSPTSSSSRQSSVVSTPGHSRSSSIASNISTATAKPVVSPVTAAAPTTVSSSSSGMRPGQPNAPTYAQSTYFSQQQQQAQGQQQGQQQPGYPYVPAYPYLPAAQASGSTTPAGAVSQYARAPVFPPGTIASLATAFAASNNAAGAATTGPLGPAFTYQATTTSPTTPRPHQLLRTNSHGQSSAPATAPVVATSTVTATSTGSPHAKDEDVVMDDDGDLQMGD